MELDPRFADVPEDAEQQLPPSDKPTGMAARFVLRRFPVWPLIAWMLKKKVPVHRHSIWYTMGGAAMFFFIVQVVTGILLMIYYKPGQPWQSVQRIVMEVPFGALIRSVHHWSANLMILILALHFFSTFFMKAYRAPREFTWLTGIGLLALTMTLGFSGYMLPWDDVAFFASRVGIGELEKSPLIGPLLADIARGGPDITLDTVGRFFMLHVFLLPLTLMGLLGLHLFFIQVQGVSEPDSFAAQPPEKKRYHKFWEFMVGEIPIWLFLGVLLVALSALLPRTLEPEADPFAPAPLGIKPEWYFLFPFQVLKLFPGSLEFVGMALTGLIPAAAVMLPFVDRSVPADQRGKMISRAGFALLVVILSFTIWGWLSK